MGRLLFILFSLSILSLKGAEPNICLAITVRNHESTIWKCLNSVRHLIDCICVCNANSTDDTMPAVEFMMLEDSRQGKIYNVEWKDAGYNRTLLYQKAQETLQALHYPLENSYILILEPDQYLDIDPTFSKENLQEDGYFLLGRWTDHHFCQYFPNFFRASQPHEWKEPIYLDSSYDPHFEKFPLLHIVACDDSNEKKKTKLENELETVIQVLKSESKNEKYLFFQAQINRGLNRYKEAIRIYKEYINKGDDKEKVWFSKYMIGECFEEMGYWDKALSAYLEAYQYNSLRAEPLWKIAYHYRKNGQNDLAYLFAKHGSRIQVPSDTSLFPMEIMTDYRFDEELSVAAYYTQFKEDGLLAADAILLNKKAPYYLKSNTYKNLFFYVENLKNATFLPIELDLPYIEEGLSDRYNPMNPSIQRTRDGYKVICRTVNYTQQGAKSFQTVASDGIFRTRNFLLDYTPDFRVISQKEIIEDLPRERIRTFSLEGLDDCRIFDYKNGLWFTCSTGDTNPYGNFQISLCKLEDYSSFLDVYVEDLTPLLGPDPKRCEKNWLPFVQDNELHVIYSYAPFTIFQPDPETGECIQIMSYESEYDFSAFRGSAGPIAFDNGYLILVHEVTFFPDQSRCYLHRFLYVDKQFQVKKVSCPFTFKHLGVEYCCGMTIDHSGDQLVLTIGIEDREAHLCFVDLQTVQSLLRTL